MIYLWTCVTWNVPSSFSVSANSIIFGEVVMKLAAWILIGIVVTGNRNEDCFEDDSFDGLACCDCIACGLVWVKMCNFRSFDLANFSEQPSNGQTNGIWP